VVDVAAIILFSSCLIGMALVQYEKAFVCLVKTMPTTGIELIKTQWLNLLVWVFLAVWVLYTVFM